MTAADPERSTTRKLVGLFLLAVLLVAALELSRWSSSEELEEIYAGWLCGVDADALPILPWVLLAPLVWFGAGWKTPRQSFNRFETWCALGAGKSGFSQLRNWDCGALIAALALAGLGGAMNRWAALSMNGLPPGYHDEYSYLFQAETFAAGRLWFPSFHPHPELFDQMHVLNEGRLASRYFPGVGLWLLPFLIFGDPHLSGTVALGIVCAGIFGIGRELANNGVGLLAGLLTALSPGILLFSTTLLAHLPTLAALTLFMLAMLRGMRRDSNGLMIFAGLALCAAMLCRPMTAAGIAFPWGVWFAVWWLTGRDVFRKERQARWTSRTVTALCLGGPILAGLCGSALYNRAITGHALLSPYQLYTDLYTPRHVYGFNNVVRGEEKLGPRVLNHYDRWAENLTPALAKRNVIRRMVASMRGSLGIIPLLLGVTTLILFPPVDSRWILAACSIVSLHVAHIPYWFEGIMGWHYVFESAPLWLLLSAQGFGQWKRAIESVGHLPLIWCLRGMLLTSVAVNLVTFIPFWPGRVPRGLVEMAYPRKQYAAFDRMLADATQGSHAIVFVVPDPNDQHMDYVTNDPALSRRVLRARLDDPLQASRMSTLFPDRTAWLYDAKSQNLRRVVPNE